MRDNLSTVARTPEPERVKVRCKADLNAAVGESVMGWGPLCLPYAHIGAIQDGFHRMPVLSFCTDPVASFALRQKMYADGWRYRITANEIECSTTFQRGSMKENWGYAEADGTTEAIAVALAALSAKGVTVELTEGWESR